MSKYKFILILFLFFPILVFASSIPGAISELSISLSSYSINPGDSINIHVEGRSGGNFHETDGKLSIDMGDGQIELTNTNCGRPGFTSVCIDDLSHTYNIPGTYNVVVEMCVINVLSRRCLTETAQVVVRSEAPVCIPDNCNEVCPNFCTLAEDPDCGCLDGDGCCGIDCDDTNDNDCLPGSDIATRYDNPLLAENIVQFIGQAIVFLFTASLYFAVLMILVGSYLMITSGGLPSKIDKGKKIVIWTLVAVAIILVSRGIIELVWMLLGKE